MLAGIHIAIYQRVTEFQHNVAILLPHILLWTLFDEPLPSIVGEPLGPTYVDSILEKYLFPLFDEPQPTWT
jgi:hypothetical protein